MLNKIIIFTVVYGILATGIYLFVPAEIDHGMYRAFAFGMLNSLTFLSLLLMGLRKPLLKYLLSRCETIRLAVDEANIEIEKAKEIQKEYEEKIQGLDKEIAQIKDQFAMEGKLQKMKLIEEGEAYAKKLEQETIIMSQNDLQRAKEEIKKTVYKDVLEDLKKEIKNVLTQDKQKNLLNKTIERLKELS